MVDSLLAAFPTARRALLADVLLGHAVAQTAQRHGVTQRTVRSTMLVATKLLEQAG